VGDVAEWSSDDPTLQVIDIRNPGEQEAGIVPGAVSIPLPHLLEHHDELDRDRPTVVYCAGGYRSSAGASLLRARGFSQVADTIGGFDAWRDAGLPVAPVGAGA
jgi:rhodanese-related sulfurtransferase